MTGSFKQWCKGQSIKRTKPTPTNMLSCKSLPKHQLGILFQKDILQHFSALLSTNTKQVERTFDRLKEKVTPSRRYTSLQNTIVCLDPDCKEKSNTYMVDGIANAPAPIVKTQARVAPFT